MTTAPTLLALLLLLPLAVAAPIPRLAALPVAAHADSACPGSERDSDEGFAPLQTGGSRPPVAIDAYQCLQVNAEPQDGFHGRLTATLDDGQGHRAYVTVDCPLVFIPLDLPVIGRVPVLADLFSCTRVAQGGGGLEPGRWTLSSSTDTIGGIPALGQWRVSFLTIA